MRVYDTCSKIKKKKVDEVVKAEAIIKTFKEKEKKSLDKNIAGGGQSRSGPIKKVEKLKKALFEIYLGL